MKLSMSLYAEYLPRMHVQGVKQLFLSVVPQENQQIATSRHAGGI